MINTDFPLYSLFIIIALLSNIIIILLTSKYSKIETICLLLYENTGILLGAKLLTYILNYSKYDEFDFFKLGLSSYGAVIGALLFLLLFSLQFKKPFKDLLSLFIVPIPLMYAIGKIGCFLVGCCYGIKYSGIFSVVYNYSLHAPVGVSLFPIQIVESIVFLLIFIYMLNKKLQNKFNTQAIGISFIFCGLAKFILDFFRMSHQNVILSINQYISLFFIVVGFIVLLSLKKNKI